MTQPADITGGGVLNFPAAPKKETGLSDTSDNLVSHRSFTDIPEIRNSIFDSSLNAINTKYPLSNDTHELHIENARYSGKSDFSLADQKKAILARDTLDRPIKGDWVLRRKADGSELAREKDKIVARVPYMTPRGTFILRGNEYTVAHQQRLRPGIYARVKDNGELESHVNLIPGSGKSFRLHMEPDTGVLKIQVNQSHVPVIGLLRSLGASDKDIADAWGHDLFATNVGREDGTHTKKIFERLADFRTKDKYKDNVTDGLKQIFAQMVIDPEVSSRNLGQPFKAVDHKTLLAATKKLIEINRGQADSDDRDNQANQTIHGPEDLFAERIQKDSGRFGRMLLQRAVFTGKLDHVRSGALTPQLHAVLLHSGLGQPLAEINPIEITDQLLRVSRLGDGGIPSTDAIPAEARNVQPSQLGYIDPVLGPESESIGVDTRLANGTRKGRDNLLYQEMMDPKTGQNRYVSAREAVGKVMAFPGEFEDLSRDTVRAIVNGKMTYVPRGAVDLVLPKSHQMFSLGANLVPGVGGIKGGRLLMAGKMIRQALPLATAEAPLVQSANDEGSWEEHAGKFVGTVHAKNGGLVTYVGPGRIRVLHDDGKHSDHELYDHFPFNYKTFVHNTPVVKVGDRVNPNQLLARSNYTDDKGALAMGANFRVGYLPWGNDDGNNYEDAIVISASAAKRLTSEHMKQHSWTPAEGRKVDKRDYISRYPDQFDRRQFNQIDDEGVVKPGAIVHPGDPLILGLHTKAPEVGTALTRYQKSYTNADPQTWKGRHPGVVTDVHRDSSGIKVTVKTHMPMQVGDKMSGRYGDKGVVGAIVPDEQMPRDAEDKPMEVLLNPLGIISRTNPSQVVEAALGKIARKHGKNYKLPAFGTNLVKYAQEELAKHGMQDTEGLFDPRTNRHLKDVFTGERFFYKLYHTADSKESGRDVGGYTAEGQPAKGGGSEGSSKRLGMLDLNALISHGATEVIRDAKFIRGQKNDEFWSRFRSGQPLPTTNRPLIRDKFLTYLRGAGIHVADDGQRIHFKAMTDRDIDQLSAGAVRNGHAVKLSDNSPIEGGLFDVGLTGGHHGTRWSHIQLHTPMPNPVMEEPIRRLLGMTQKQFEAKISSAGGAEELHKKLKSLDVDQAIDDNTRVFKTGRKTHRDTAIRNLRYLTMMKKTGIKPEELFINKFPVIPPNFRPVSKQNGMQLSSDANHLYTELFEADRNTRDVIDAGLDYTAERGTLYKTMKAAAGLGDPVGVKLQEKNVAGLLTHVFGKGAPKSGMFQRRLLAGTLDVVGRAAITPNPSLDMDHVGLPESKAWTIYRPFIMRRLARQYNAGENKVPTLELARWIANKDPRAKRAMEEEIAERPVLINRAPVWHRYGFMAAYPKLIKGETLQISPITTPGFGADFDGDAMNYSVPTSDAAVKEAVEKMLPSRNLFSARNFDVHMLPRQEYLHGIFIATRNRSKDQKPTRVFASAEDVKKAYYRGEIAADDPVTIANG